ncbi:sensor histidine kinase [Paramicrobacterium fandaimingii]|uniref:sensor histidine kinase n=1 Tax=Paramicrobacterium fandaimingii TaxID=2708079 RepID=UPI001423C785|nr:histidine kinase [Microbacterium fandaimingii]
MTNTVWAALRRSPVSFLRSWWPWRALLFLLTSAVLGVLLLAVTVLTLVLLPLWGIALGALERRRTRLLGFDRLPTGHVRLGRDQRPHWLSIRLVETATWRETAALFVDIVLGMLSLTVLFVEFAALAVPVAIAIAAIQGPRELNLFGDVYVTVTPGNWWPAVPVAAVLLALFAYLNVVIASGHAYLLRLLCGPRQEELERNVERLSRSRAALVAGFEAERRRIERDLHDGVQQELVTLAARLGMVSLDLDQLTAKGAETDAARAALAAAQDQAEHAMATLRNTVRGIHPAELTDHGLAAALDELAERAPVELRLDVDVGDRMLTSIETAAYYVVTEAITNAAKHTTSTRLTVRARSGEDGFDMMISDNGNGGADPDAGTGLRGLAERAETLGGVFTVDSPIGGPTTLRLQLPLTDLPLTEQEPARADSAG